MRASIYSTTTGLFTGQQVAGSPAICAMQATEGFAVMEGEHDHLCRRVDLASGQVVPWQPPKPADTDLQTWSWDEATERWVTTPTPAAIAVEMRASRDQLLARSDWVVTRATELGEAVPAAWLAYRQALRDLPEQGSFPTEVSWPEPPQVSTT